MRVGDMIRIVTWRSQDEPVKTGLIVSIGKRHNNRRVATVLMNGGAVATWPLDSHYEIEVINESH